MPKVGNEYMYLISVNLFGRTPPRTHLVSSLSQDCGMYSIRSTLGRRTISTSALRRCYDPRNRISMAYNATLKRAVPSSSESSKPLFLTKDSFEEHIKSQRTQSVGEDYGLKPTKMQKFFLLATHIYEKDADIPAYVACTTLNRMYDRMRILTSTFGITLFFIVLYCCQLASINKIKQAREDAGYKMH
ncbi:unnamed protein product [Cylicocyclus nassatus]|uniref:Uncharacterized protein n=1 Tax=Cylicocyclus nassatus TaxID=53992 RepID=A0AA36GF68_CYLNA|nr:unnamed protein product [Cylicocyclus nassatus]